MTRYKSVVLSDPVEAAAASGTEEIWLLPTIVAYMWCFQILMPNYNLLLLLTVLHVLRFFVNLWLYSMLIVQIYFVCSKLLLLHTFLPMLRKPIHFLFLLLSLLPYVFLMLCHALRSEWPFNWLFNSINIIVLFLSLRTSPYFSPCGGRPASICIFVVVVTIYSPPKGMPCGTCRGSGLIPRS